jgi:hypothetical protein
VIGSYTFCKLLLPAVLVLSHHLVSMYAALCLVIAVTSVAAQEECRADEPTMTELHRCENVARLVNVVGVGMDVGVVWQLYMLLLLLLAALVLSHHLDSSNQLHRPYAQCAAFTTSCYCFDTIVSVFA